MKLVVSIAPLIGVTIHKLNFVKDSQFSLVFGLVIGMFFYVVIKDSMPKEDQGKPFEYIIGMILYLSVILIVNWL